MCQATGWTWDHVEDHLTMPQLKSLSRFWAQSPPPHVLLKFIAEAVGVRLGAEAAEHDKAGWSSLRALSDDPKSGLAIRGKPPL